MRPDVSVSDELQQWLESDHPKTLGSLIGVFRERSFAILFVVLLAVPALPVPTGGATHVFEAVAMLLALELMAGRRTVWLPARLLRRELSGGRRLVEALLKRIRWVERHSQPRGRRLFRGRLSGALFGAVVLGLTATAFFAPPFSGLDTLPAMGVVVLALGYLVEDAAVAVAGLVLGTLGVVLVVGFGSLVARFVGDLI